MFDGLPIAGLLQFLGGGAIAVAIIRAIPPLKKIANDREANLLSERAAEMEAMRDRIDRLEEGRTNDRKEFEAKLVGERAKHDRDKARYRHRVNNLQQSFDALLLLLAKVPEAAGVIEQITEMRARQLEAEALEAGQNQAADIEEAKR